MKLSEKVDSALQLLATYNSRLDMELEERKRIALMLHDYIQAQKGERKMAAELKLQVFSFASLFNFTPLWYLRSRFIINILLN